MGGSLKTILKLIGRKNETHIWQFQSLNFIFNKKYESQIQNFKLKTKDKKTYFSVKFDYNRHIQRTQAAQTTNWEGEKPVVIQQKIKHLQEYKLPNSNTNL